MTTARTEPSDGFLDREFASFREARLRAKKAKNQDALEHRPAKVAEVEPAPPAAAATNHGAPPPEDAFFGTSTHERTSIRARTRDDRTTAMLEVMLDDLDNDVAATRTGPRVEESPTPSAPAARAEARVAPPPPSDDDTRGMTRAVAGVEGHSSDPEFERFRAARKKADSGRLRKPETRPDSGRLRKPDAEGHSSDPEFERFRAARQSGEALAPRRADSGRLRKPEAPAAVSPIEALLAISLPESTPSPPEATASAVEAPSAPVIETLDDTTGTVFFGTSVQERAVVRARVLGDSPDPDEPAPRRAPPPPLPERPSA